MTEDTSVFWTEEQSGETLFYPEPIFFYSLVFELNYLVK